MRKMPLEYICIIVVANVAIVISTNMSFTYHSHNQIDETI